MTDAIRPCAGQDLDQILEVINDAAQAYDGVIPADRCQKPYMPLAELRHAKVRRVQHSIGWLIVRAGTRIEKLYSSQNLGQPFVLAREG